MVGWRSGWVAASAYGLAGALMFRSLPLTSSGLAGSSTLPMGREGAMSHLELSPGDDGIHEACGVFGIYGPGEDVARLTFFGLYALQHRGQESAGIATADGERINLYAEMGLVNQVFSEENLADLTGHIAIGHTRYSTTGSSCVENAQPIMVGS